MVGGGTGGHLFPAIALGEELSRLRYKVCLVTDTRCKGYLGPDMELQTYILSLGSLRSGIFAKILILFRIVAAIIQSLRIVHKDKASIVIGFGGYTAFPTLFAARLLKIPIMLHEQNCFFGKVNSLFAKSAVCVALNFAETSNIPTGCQDKVIIAGNPVRSDIRRIDAKRNFSTDGIKVLVIGGSQGAKVFSNLVPEAIKILKYKDSKIKISVTQQASIADQGKIREIYDDVGIDYELKEFFHDMPMRYLASDLAICRAGASTIAELIHLGQPAILIPFPFAAEDHQFFNASVLVSKSAAWCFRQQELTPEILADQIIEIANTPGSLDKVSRKLLSLSVLSEKILADTVVQIIGK